MPAEVAMTRIVGLAAGLVLAVSCAGNKRADAPRAWAPDASKEAASPAPSSTSAAPTTSVEDERRADEIAYQFLYLPEKPRLERDARGGWVAIAGGRLVPATGARIEPAKSMDDAVSAARAAAPEAKHRFVFQVGEDGAVDLPLGGCELAHILGTPFVALLQRNGDVQMNDLGPDQPIRAKFGGESRELTVKGPDRRMFVRPEVGPPGADGKASEIYCIGTGFAGHATMSSATAAGAGLELWEIPGVANVAGALQSGTCRRARARFRWTGSNVDFVVPVAIWPR